MVMNQLKRVSKTLRMLAKLNQLINFTKLLHNNFNSVLSVVSHAHTGVLSDANFVRLADIKVYVLNPDLEITNHGSRRIFGSQTLGAPGGEFQVDGEVITLLYVSSLIWGICGRICRTQCRGYNL